MNLALMILLPFPLGWFVRSRLAAYLTYTAAFSFLFTFQSAMLVVEWVGGSSRAFGPTPKANSADVYSYAVVNLIIYAVGLGLLALGQWLSGRRRSTRPHQHVELAHVS